MSKNGQKCILNCLLDSGSQRSYLSDEVAKELDIKKTGPAVQNEDVFRGRYEGSNGSPH